MPAEKKCSRCKYKLTKSICGFPESPKYRKEVEQSSYSCDHFLENPAQDHLTLGLVKAVEDEAALEAIKEFDIAIKLGLPHDDEMIARDFLGRSLEHLAKGGASNHEFQESINEREKAILMGSEGEYGYFSDPLNRASLESLDANYVLQARSIQKKEGVNAAVSYLTQKLSLFNYLSSAPILTVLLELGNLYAEKGETSKARESWEKILNAERVRMGEEGFEKRTKEMAQNNLRLLESKDTDKHISRELRSTTSLSVAPSSGSWKLFLMLAIIAVLFLIGGIYSLFVILALAAGVYWWFKLK